MQSNLLPADLELLISGQPFELDIEINGLNGSVNLTDDDIIGGSFYIDRNSVSGFQIEIGNAETTEVGFVIDNDDRRFDGFWFEGAEVIIDIIIGSSSLRAGKFTVDQPPQGFDSIKIVALDNMARFSQPYSTTLIGTASLLDLLQNACTACSVTLATTSFTNSSYQAIVPADLDITCHNVVSMIAELSGTIAWIDENGELRLSWYGENQGSAEINITDEEVVDYDEVAENDVFISGLLYRTEDADYLYGLDNYTLVIENNPLIDPDNYQSMLQAIFNKIDGFFYRPFRFGIIPLPHIWPLDVVQIRDPQGSIVPSIVSNHRLTMDDGCRMEARGETATVAGYASFSPFSNRQQTAIAKSTREVVSVMGINADWITAGILSADRIGVESITTEKLDAGAVTAEKIAVGAIVADSAVIQDGAITSAKIGDAQITSAKIANGAITTALIDTAAIGTTQIADGSITDAKIVGLTANKITAGTIDATNIEVVNLKAANITVGTINGQQISDGAISSEKLAADSVTAEKVAVGAISAEHLANGSITGDKIAAGAIKETQMNWSTHLLF